MEFSKKESYAIQIGNYLKNGRYAKALELSTEMTGKFPKEPLSHFMAAKSYYFSGKYEKAKMEGRKAFNLSHTKSDMMFSAIITASALFMLGKYDEAHKLLVHFEGENNEDVEKLLLIFYAVKGDGGKAGEYYKELYSLNMDIARKFIRKLAGISEA